MKTLLEMEGPLDSNAAEPIAVQIQKMIEGVDVGYARISVRIADSREALDAQDQPAKPAKRKAPPAPSDDPVATLPALEPLDLSWGRGRPPKGWLLEHKSELSSNDLADWTKCKACCRRSEKDPAITVEGHIAHHDSHCLGNS